MRLKTIFYLLITAILFSSGCSTLEDRSRDVRSFNDSWQFLNDEPVAGQMPDPDLQEWKTLDLPHDWSIEGPFSEEYKTTINQGALPAGIGWYMKMFRMEPSDSGKCVFIDFDGVYRDSKVWINGYFLGQRPSGYMPFRYELTPYLEYGNRQNVIAVRVDNSQQPCSRWYTGSGIYRNVWLTVVSKIHVAHRGTFMRTAMINDSQARAELEMQIENRSGEPVTVTVKTTVYDHMEEPVSITEDEIELVDSLTRLTQVMKINDPELWSVSSPAVYTAVTKIFDGKKEMDNYPTGFGIRHFAFDSDSGFFLNGSHVELKGVNMHHGLGALGSAVNRRAIERQLQILKGMGVNAIRTAHNPPAPELLDLCDKMGFLVMDEAFDMWAKGKNRYDYHIFWEDWHEKDLKSMVLRDRNHPSVIAWSIGNEIREQFDSTGITIARELVNIVKTLDDTRPVTCALTEQDPSKNYIYQSGDLDLISFNYKPEQYADFPGNYPGEAMLSSETGSAFATRGYYDMPSDSIRIWPSAYRAPLVGANAGHFASSYDNVHAYWGTTHEENFRIVNKYPFISGMFIWSGFDYLGEPTPYEWPSRSSYFGVVDLAGFPKDIYYMYKSEWTDEPVLHLFPHWNWKEGQVVDVWAYYNNADEVELFLNDVSQGIRKKPAGQYHVMWRLNFEPGTLKAVSRKNGQTVLEKEIVTAGSPYRIELEPDRSTIMAGGTDLSFITVKILDEQGVPVPTADNLVSFELDGNGSIAAVDNGYQASLESFRADHREAFNGRCLLIIRSGKAAGKIGIKAVSEGLVPGETVITCKEN